MMTRVEDTPAAVLLMLAERRRHYGNDGRAWVGVGPTGLSLATIARLSRMGFVETRPTLLSGIYQMDARATFVGCVAAEAIK